jgi:hypothetical protein
MEKKKAVKRVAGSAATSANVEDRLAISPRNIKCGPLQECNTNEHDCVRLLYCFTNSGRSKNCANNNGNCRQLIDL